MGGGQVLGHAREDQFDAMIDEGTVGDDEA